VLGRHQQHRAAAAADVEQPLVPSELEPIEEVSPDGELARAGGADVDACVEKQPERAHAEGDDGDSIRRHRPDRALPQPPHAEGEQARAAEGHQERCVRCVEAVVTPARREGTHGETKVT
jgi:hypothetical protein